MDIQELGRCECKVQMDYVESVKGNIYSFGIEDLRRYVLYCGFTLYLHVGRYCR